MCHTELYRRQYDVYQEREQLVKHMQEQEQERIKSYKEQITEANYGLVQSSRFQLILNAYQNKQCSVETVIKFVNDMINEGTLDRGNLTSAAYFRRMNDILALTENRYGLQSAAQKEAHQAIISKYAGLTIKQVWNGVTVREVKYDNSLYAMYKRMNDQRIEMEKMKAQNNAISYGK